MWTAKDIATVGLSSVAFLLSALTAWVTLLRRGRLFMVRPSQIYFGSERGEQAERGRRPKVYLRTTLFSSGKRGNIVESLYVRVRRGETVQNFNIWVFGEKQLSRGSALYVGEQGVASNHHFLLPEDGTSFVWLEGEYILQVHANLVPGQHSLQLHESRLALGDQDAAALRQGSCGVFFDWSPETKQYHRHIRQVPPSSPEAAV